MYKYVPTRAIAVPSLVLSVSLLPKKTTDVPMMTTLLTTLHTPCDTGVTRDSVLKANCTTKTKTGAAAAGISQLLKESSKVKRACRRAQPAHIARRHTFARLFAECLPDIQVSCVNTLADIYTPMQVIAAHKEACNVSGAAPQQCATVDRPYKQCPKTFPCTVLLRQQLTSFDTHGHKMHAWALTWLYKWYSRPTDSSEK